MKKIEKKEWMILIFIFFVLLIRSFFSFCQSDETFYLSTVDRFWRGDIPIIDEWHPSQFSALVLLPIYSLFRVVSPNASSLILTFRIIQIIVTFFTSIYLLKFLKTKHNSFLSTACSVIYLIYCRENILGTSYYSMFTCFLTISILLILDYKEHENNKLLILSGLFSGLTVLEMPTSIFAIAVCILCYIIQSKIKNKKYKNNILNYLIGMIIVGVTIMIFLIFKTSMKEFITNFYHLFTDAEHSGPLVSSAFNSIRNLGDVIVNNRLYILLILILTFVNSKYNFLVLSIIVVKQLICLVSSGLSMLESYLLLVVGCLPMVLKLLITNKHNETTLISIISIIFSFTFAMGSNLAAECLLPGLVLAVCVIIPLYVNEKAQKNIALFQQISVVFLVALLLVSRILYVYRDDSIDKLDTQIKYGIASGLLTTKEHSDQYDRIYECINKINRMNMDGGILVSAILPWSYIVLNNKAASPTTWRTYINNSNLKEYLELNGMPNIILLLNDNIGDYPENRLPNKNYKEGKIYEIINNYRKIETNIGTLYINNK